MDGSRAVPAGGRFSSGAHGAPEPVTARAEGRLRSLAVAGALVVIWEGGKFLFAIPTYKLPHIHQIFADFLRRTGGDELMAWIMAQNAAVTAVESLAGFALGGGAGLLLPVTFAYSRLLQPGGLPYVIPPHTVPILARAPIGLVSLRTSWLS